MTKKSAESYVSLKGNDKAISILQNVINGNGGSKEGAMVNQNVARFDASFILFVLLFQMCKQTNKKQTN